MVHYLKIGLMLGTLAGSAMVWAGEIVILPPKSDVPSSETQAHSLREAARAERKEQSPVTSSVIIIPEEEGVLSPRHSTGASENRTRARANRKDEDATEIISPLILVPVSPVISGVPSAAQSARSNRERAIEYRQRDHSHSEHSKDGLPIIDCQATGNVSGRIGDDTQSGSVVILIQDRQQIKARCR